MLNVTVYLGSTTPSSNRAGPRAPLAPLSPSPAARWAPLVSITVARYCCRGPPVSLTPPPLFGRQRAWRTSRVPAGFRPLSAGHHSPVGRDPPARAPCPPRVGHVARPPSPPCLTRPSQKGVGRRRRASAPFFPPPSSLRAPRSKLHRRPSVPSSEHRFLTRILATAPPPFTRSISRRLRRFPVNLDPTSPHSFPPHGAELGPRRRRPPSHCPPPPPTRRRLGEPRRRSSCLAPPRDHRASHFSR
jgi:hypothetical protein